MSPLATFVLGNWRDRATCREMDLAIFFPEPEPDHGGPEAIRKHRAYDQARAICAVCPVRAECLADELRRGTNQQHGMRGGLEPWERRRLVRRQWRKTS